MFTYAISFNQDIGAWNVSKVKDFGYMFEGAELFNQEIADWNVGSALDMEAMFQNALNFNQNLTGWCVSNFPSEPFNFATESALSDENKPIWGTCP